MYVIAFLLNIEHIVLYQLKSLLALFENTIVNTVQRVSEFNYEVLGLQLVAQTSEDQFENINNFWTRST